MRTAKYHDYTILRVLLFIILVILGIFAFKQFVKTPCEHKAASNSWITVDATCTEDGYKYKVCTECGEQFDNQVIASQGHKESADVIVVEEPTCTKTGTGYKACSVCKEQLGFVEIPVVEHTKGEQVIENVKEHTISQGASYEEVVYCTVCNEELSREKRDVAHNDVVVYETIASNPTCTEQGKVITTTYCNVCDKELDVKVTFLEPYGHSYDWTLEKNGDDFILSGTCTAVECGHEYDPATDAGYTYNVVHSHDTNCVDPTCVCGRCVYVATIYYNGSKIAEASAEEEFAAVLNHTVFVDGVSVDISTYALVDDNGNVYYDIKTPGMVLVYEQKEGQTISEAIAEAWEKALRENNGFAEGAFKCSTCGTWINVRVYNSELA